MQVVCLSALLTELVRISIFFTSSSVVLLYGVLRDQLISLQLLSVAKSWRAALSTLEAHGSAETPARGCDWRAMLPHQPWKPATARVFSTHRHLARLLHLGFGRTAGQLLTPKRCLRTAGSVLVWRETRFGQHRSRWPTILETPCSVALDDMLCTYLIAWMPQLRNLLLKCANRRRPASHGCVEGRPWPR